MNYGKKATEKKIKAAGSRSRKYTTRVFLTFFKTCLILCTFCLIVAVDVYKRQEQPTYYFRDADIDQQPDDG